MPLSSTFAGMPFLSLTILNGSGDPSGPTFKVNPGGVFKYFKYLQPFTAFSVEAPEVIFHLLMSNFSILLSKNTSAIFSSSLNRHLLISGFASDAYSNIELMSLTFLTFQLLTSGFVLLSKNMELKFTALLMSHELTSGSKFISPNIPEKYLIFPVFQFAKSEPLTFPSTPKNAY